MSNLIPINKDEFMSRSWDRPGDFKFAASDTLCALAFSELRQAALVLPLAFVPVNGESQLVAVMGLFGGRNQFVDPEGKWLGSYVPSLYRLYPFRLANTESAEKVICIDNTLELLREDSEGEPFFTDGKPTALLQEVMALFSVMEEGLTAIGTASKTLADLGLLKDWDITIEIGDSKHAVNGLQCIDESKLAELDSAGLTRLQQTRSFEAAYAQLFSMRHIQVFTQLAESIKVTQPSQDNLFEEAESGTLNFDNL